MKTMLVFVILCCYSKDKNGMYKYEAVNLHTSSAGILYSSAKHSEGDTVFLTGESRPNLEKLK
jgi:hypothetical protein